MCDWFMMAGDEAKEDVNDNDKDETCVSTRMIRFERECSEKA